MKLLEKFHPKYLKMIQIKIKFEKRDLWIGVYWNTIYDIVSDYNIKGTIVQKYLFVYVCFVPCFPMIFRIKIK